MKVYIVFMSGYGGLKEIVKVFDGEEKAENYIDEISEDSNYDYYLYAYEVE
jgi:hypothetical protein